MPQLIDLSNIKQEQKSKYSKPTLTFDSCGKSDKPNEQIELFVEILLKKNSGKLIYTFQEAADIIGIGQEFIRRRIKTGKIKAVSFGDKPMINIVELAKILAEGVN